MTTWRPIDPSRDSGPRRLSESLDRVTRRLGSPAAGVFARLFSGWEELVGADIAAHARPVSVKRGVLVLEVDHPVWATQLRYMTADLLARIREDTGSSEVVEIHLKVMGYRAGNYTRFGRS
ncbi:MAG: DUF721 domain-containing protein [Acidimicrobiales bacterium]|nr:DUF721 domain-containing protein [Acidimicrobiales bacterium]